MQQTHKRNYPKPDIMLSNSVVSSNSYTGLVPTMPGDEEEAENYEGLYNSTTYRA
jgi:hypothetical protein